MKFQITFLFAFLFIIPVSILAQDSLSVLKKDILNTQSLLNLKVNKIKSDSTQFETPKYKQGFFCNFEDQLNRKKVPIDFNLGNSKY
jgi:hypothetical protein